MLYPNTDLLSFPSSVCVCVLFQGDLSPSEHERRSVLHQQQRSHHHHRVCKWKLHVSTQGHCKDFNCAKNRKKNVCVVCTLLLLLLLLSPTFLSFLSCLTFSTLSFVFLLFFLVAKPQRLVAVSHPTKTLWTSVCWAQKKVKEAAWWPWSSRFNILVLWVKHLWQMHSWYCYLEVVHVWNGAAFQSMKTS